MSSHQFVPFDLAKEWMLNWRKQTVKPDVNGFTIPFDDIQELYQLPDLKTIRIYFGFDEHEIFPMPCMKLLIVGVDEHGNDILPQYREIQGFPVTAPPANSSGAVASVTDGILDNTRPSPPFSGASLLVRSLE